MRFRGMPGNRSNTCARPTSRSLFSYFLAGVRLAEMTMIIGEHLGIAITVVVLSHLIGVWVSETFS